jgi:uncharacterized membrane protein (DUF485 family)
MRIIEAITAPLGFFVLALLIVETFLGLVLTKGTFEKGELFQGIWIGVGLFVFLIILVSILVWFKPENLTFDKNANLKRLEIPPYGSSNALLMNSNDQHVANSPSERS